MGIENNNLDLLFLNVANLLNEDLKVYKMHSVEEAYFKEAIELFESIQNVIIAWNTQKPMSFSNLASFYAIPKIYSAYEKNKNSLQVVSDAKGKNAQEEMFKAIHFFLNEYYVKKILDKRIKEALKEFFNYLYQQQTVQYQFERIENPISAEYKKIEYAQ